MTIPDYDVCDCGICGIHSKCREQAFEPEYYSALNWKDAIPFVGKIMEFSENGVDWHSDTLKKVHPGQRVYHFQMDRHPDDNWMIYCRTCPETFAAPHPTVKITVGEKEFHLPKPETQAPPVGTKYWLFNLVLMGTVSCKWDGDPGDYGRLEKGNVQLSEERAKAWVTWWKEMIEIMEEQP